MKTEIKSIIVASDEGQTRYGFSDFKFTRTYVELADGSQVQVHSESKIGEHGETSEEWSAERVKQFLKGDGKVFEDYCRGGGEQHETHDLLGFMDWVEKNLYHFDTERTLFFEVNEAPRYKNIKGIWNFHGNLKEYSSAFSFYIFDTELKEIIQERLRRNAFDDLRKIRPESIPAV